MSRAHRILVLAGVAVLSASTIATAQPPRAEETGRGSVRNSSAKVKKKKQDTAKRTTARTTSARRSGARAGYRAGYRRGRYHGWNDARRSYRRWRAVTGLFKLGVYGATKPKRTTTVVVTGTTYYYAGGVYYVASGSGYVVVAPPPGAGIPHTRTFGSFSIIPAKILKPEPRKCSVASCISMGLRRSGLSEPYVAIASS